MKKRSLLLVTLLPILLSGCFLDKIFGGGDEKGPSNHSEPEEQSVIETEDYVQKSVNVYRRKEVVDKKVPIRFYKVQINIPYISVSEYFYEFFNTRLTKSVIDHKYTYTNSFEGTLTFDVKNSTFSSIGLSSFSNHPDFIENNSKLFIKYLKRDEGTSIEKSVSLSKYDIAIYEDEDVYAPLSFLSSLAGGLAGYNVSYNGKDIYVLDFAGQLGLETDPKYFGKEYFNENSEPRPNDIINYTYNELCFVFDNLRGYTKQLYMGDDNLLGLCLDGVLSRDYPKTKEYLLSRNKDNYFEGLNALFNALNDGGHTTLAYAGDSFGSAAVKLSEQEFENINSDVSSLSTAKTATKASFYGAKSSFASISEKKYYHYDDDAKTSYIGFDQFNVDYQGWDDYYNGLKDAPVSSDTYAYVRSKMIQAKKDGAKNLVLDLTTNGGGSSYALEGILGLFNNAQGYIRIKDTFNDYIETEYHSIDLNLDGKFDDLDKEYASSFNFNVGVLTSNYAFSCGNLLPFNMKELGYKIIGEKTGGGSCAVSYETIQDGIVYVHSSYLCLVDKNGENIDGGVEVDFPIERTQISSYLYDCSNFFNFSVVGSYLDSAYTE